MCREPLSLLGGCGWWWSPVVVVSQIWNLLKFYYLRRFYDYLRRAHNESATKIQHVTHGMASTPPGYHLVGYHLVHAVLEGNASQGTPSHPRMVPGVASAEAHALATLHGCRLPAPVEVMVEGGDRGGGALGVYYVAIDGAGDAVTHRVRSQRVLPIVLPEPCILNPEP